MAVVDADHYAPRLPTAIALLASLFLCSAANAAEASADDLAKQLNNPVSSLISVPLQLNSDFGSGEGDGERFTLNVQPVIPKSIGERWNLITRVIVPVVYQTDVVPRSDQLGLGDTTPTLFFSPKAPAWGRVVWAVGPVFLLPTATDELLGTEKWGAGPSVLALEQTQGGYTYGLLANHLWSVAGDSRRGDVSSTFLQPFLAKQLGAGRSLTFNLESTYDWKGEQWTVPLNVTFSKVTKIGRQRLSFAGGARAYLDKPEGGPDWGLRFVTTLLFPGG
jgi:hypothetical protein